MVKKQQDTIIVSYSQQLCRISVLRPRYDYYTALALYYSALDYMDKYALEKKKARIRRAQVNGANILPERYMIYIEVG